MSGEATVFRGLIRGNRLRLYSGIDPEKFDVAWGSKYTYISFKAKSAVNLEGQSRVNLKAGQSYIITVDCGDIAPKMFKSFVQPSPELLEAGMVQMQHLYEEEDKGPVVVRFTPDSDVRLDSFDRVVRLYQFL